VLSQFVACFDQLSEFPMKRTAWLVSLLVCCFLRMDPVFAEPSSGKGGGNKQADAERQDGKGKGKDRDRFDDRRQGERDRRGESDRERGEARHIESSRPSGAVSLHFEDRHRTTIRDFYAAEYRSGHCPPGLAKKNNGCMPPGQAKKWRKGQPLSRDVIFYEIPSELVIRIGTPPPGHRYVRVAADILLIAIGTGMVVDAIADLGRM
jgi:Ni/Co efflux regulator RcnB